jgi:hypothetical protein
MNEITGKNLSQKNSRGVKWSNGYKNDVWRSEGTEWIVDADIRLKTSFHQKEPRVKSTMEWIKVTNGELPPPSNGTLNVTF